MQISCISSRAASAALESLIDGSAITSLTASFHHVRVYASMYMYVYVYIYIYIYIRI